jgi:hypothetical protein
LPVDEIHLIEQAATIHDRIRQGTIPLGVH